MFSKRRILYAVFAIIALVASMKASISYALLNIFISEENLPLELGIAEIVGEQGVVIFNRIIDFVIWFLVLFIDLRIFNKLGAIKSVVFLVLSPLLWVVGTYIWILIDLFIFNSFRMKLFSGSCGGTGYPILRETCKENALYALYYLNLFFWFFILWVVWEQVIAKVFHRIIIPHDQRK